MNAYHVFPYSAALSGGHSNAIRAFLDCQHAVGINAHGISPRSEGEGPPSSFEDEGIEELDFGSAGVAKEIVSRVKAPGILHLHSLDKFSHKLAAEARQAGIRTVITSHGQLNSKNMVHGAKKFAYFALFQSALRHVDGIHFLTARERDRFRYMAPFTRREVAIIPHAVGVKGELVRHTQRAKQPRSDTGPDLRILHLGRLDIGCKGLDLLLEGFARAKLGNSRLVLAGPDWQGNREKLVGLANSLGCLDRVDFPGALYGEDKEEAFRQADVFAATSRWDAFNIALTEAMVRGVPALVSANMNLAPELALDGAAEVVSCTAHGIASGLEHLFQDLQWRESCGTKGAGWVTSHCGQQHVGAAFAGFYQRLLNDRAGE